MKYDIIIVGAGPGGIFASYELVKKNPEVMLPYLKQVILLKNEFVL